MRALALLQHGGIEHLRALDLPEPELTRDDQVRIAVRTASINHLDLLLLDGLPGITLTFPHVVGTDAAGVVDRVGPAVTSLRPGDKVVVNPGVSCGVCPVCRAGEEPLCRNFGVLGEHHPGTAAEYLVLPERNVARLTNEWPWAEAAAFPLATLTAWRMLTTRSRLQPGETVLVWGIGGGVALATLQIAKLLGAKVVATSSSDAKLTRARELGADHTLNYRSQEVAREVRKLTGSGADVVVDSVGEKTWDASLKAMRPGGRLVVCGATTGPLVNLDLRRLFWWQWSLLGSTMGTTREFREIVAMANAGKLRPVVDSVVSLEQGARAYTRMASGEQLGKLVIEVSR